MKLLYNSVSTLILVLCFLTYTKQGEVLSPGRSDHDFENRNDSAGQTSASSSGKEDPSPEIRKAAAESPSVPLSGKDHHDSKSHNNSADNTLASSSGKDGHSSETHNAAAVIPSISSSGEDDHNSENRNNSADKTLTSPSEKDDFPKRGWTPLHKAAYEGNFDVVKTLIESGADVNAMDAEERLPIHLSVGNVNVARILIENGAAVNAQDDDLKNVLHWAVLRDGKRDVYEIMVQNGADIDAKDSYGSTPLHYAAWLGKPVAAEILIQLKANISVQNKKNRTPHLDAYLRGHEQLMEILKKAGSILNMNGPE